MMLSMDRTAPASRNPALFVAACILALVAFDSHAAEKSKAKPNPEKEAEEKQYQLEEETDKQLGDSVKSQFDGKVLLYPIDREQPLPEVIGTFTSEGRIYLLKMSDARLLATLAPFQGKDVTLNGKIRVNKKYFIATEVVLSDGAQPIEKRKRGGI